MAIICLLTMQDKAFGLILSMSIAYIGLPIGRVLLFIEPPNPKTVLKPNCQQNSIFKKPRMMHSAQGDHKPACYYAVIVSVLATSLCVACSPHWKDHRRVFPPASKATGVLRSPCQSWTLEFSPVSVVCSVPLTEPELYYCVE